MGSHGPQTWTSVYPALAGLTAAALSLVGTLPYLRDVRLERTRPHRGTWAIWSVIGILGTASHRADGARWSLVMVTVQTLTTLAVLALAVRRGVGTVTRGNCAMLALAAVGVVGWSWSSDPTVAIAGVILADAVGVAMMLPKTWTDPHGETLATFALAAVSGLLGMVAVARYDVGLLLLPGYLCLANTVVAALIAGRRSGRLGSGLPSPAC